MNTPKPPLAERMAVAVEHPNIAGVGLYLGSTEAREAIIKNSHRHPVTVLPAP